MSGGKKARAFHSADPRGGGYILLPHALLASDAHRTASFRARTALVAILSKFNGFNNGRICVSSAELGAALGCQNFAANSRAVGELIARGLVVLERTWPKGTRKSNEYRLTFVSSGPEGRVQPATNDYLAWREGDAGTTRKRNFGKNTLAIIAIETGVSSAVIATERKQTTAMTAIETNENGGKLPTPVSPSIAMIAAHVISHVGPSVDRSSNSLKTAGGNFTNGAEPVSAAPSEEELRSRVTSHVTLHGRGSQGRLADAAGIPAGTLSKFLKGGPLSAQARIRLTCAFPRAEGVERRTGMIG